MKNKVTMKELLGSQIIIAVLIAIYYIILYVTFKDLLINKTILK